MLDNKLDIVPSHQLMDSNDEAKKGLKKRPHHSNIAYLGCG